MKVFFGLILLILGLFMVNFPQISAEEFSKSILSPKKQIDSGKSPNEVICKEGLELIFKSSNGSPACVKSQTIKKLLLRNWAITHPISLVVFYTDKTEYEIGEPITITMKNKSNEIFSTPSVPVGFSIIDENGIRICTWIGGYEQIGSFSPQQNITKTWNQKYCDKNTPIESGTQVSSGIYTIIGDHFIHYPKPFPRLEIKLMEKTLAQNIFQHHIQVTNSDVVLRYNMSNTELVEVHKDPDAGNLIFSLANSIEEQIIIELPKNNQECLDGNPQWFVLLDGEESEYKITDESNSLIFTINIPSNTGIMELVNQAMIKGMPAGCLVIE